MATQNITFKYKRTATWAYVRVESIVSNIVFKLLLVLGMIFLSIYPIFASIIWLIGDEFVRALGIQLSQSQLTYLPLSIVSIQVFIGSLIIYYKSEVKEPSVAFSPPQVIAAIERGQKVNLANYCSLAALKTFHYAQSRDPLPEDHLAEGKSFYKALIKEPRGRFVIKKLGMSTAQFEQYMVQFYENNKNKKESVIDVVDLFLFALKIAEAEGHEKILVSDIFAALSQKENFLKKLLFSKNIKFEDVLNIVYWQTTHEIYEKEKKFNPEKPKLTGGIGKDWAMGYANTLSRFAFDLTESVSRQQTPIHLIGRKKETDEMEKTLIRANKHNVLLVGEPGTGKSTIVKNLARNVLFGQTYPAIANKRIMELNIDFLLAGAASSGEIVARLNGVLNDAVRAGNIVLFIRNAHALFSGGAKVGAIDASDVMIPYLENPQLYFIATTSTSDFHQFIEPKSGLVDKFEKINVDEPTKDETIRIIEDILFWIEPQQKVSVSYNAIQKIVDLSERFIYDKFFPEKAIDVLNELIVMVKTEGRKQILPEDVERLVSSKVNVPIGEGENVEKERLLNLEQFLHQRVIGQDIAISAVSNALRRARSGIKRDDKPIGSFLFLGPTGVGKTETSKALAENYFGDEKRMIRFDMSEYQDITGLYRLLGAPPGTPEAQTGGQLTNAVKDNPFSLILFDEIEKADPNILNIFLQILDEGWVTDSLGRKVKFNNSIIIATSNAGSEYIRTQVQQGVSGENLQEGLLNYLQEQRLFRPEFLNRFTAVVNFNPLTPSQVLQITQKMVNKLVQVVIAEKGVTLHVTDAAIKKLAELGYDPLLGARPISRVIQEKVENFLAKKLLSNQVSRGQKIVFDVSDIG